MGDVIYVGIVVGFFALMLAYIKGCESLGQEEQSDTERS
jgi:hypothetical protein